MTACQQSNSETILKRTLQETKIPDDYSAPKSSLEYLNTIYAKRPILKGALYQDYAQGPMVIADFNQDGTQELFGVHDPQEYIDFTFGPNRESLMKSPSVGIKKLKEVDWFSHFRFYDLDKVNKSLIPTVSSDLKISGDTKGCLHSGTPIVGHLNDDSFPDIIVPCHGFDAPPFPGAFSYTLISQDNGLYVAKVLPGIMHFSHRAALLDINLNGLLDIVMADGKKLYYFLNDGSGNFSKPKTLLTKQGVYTVQAADFNGDGLHDIVYGGHENEPWGDGGTNNVILWNDGSGVLSNSNQTILPKMKNYGIVLDFQLHENHLIIIRTGDDPPYKNSAIQLISLDSFAEVDTIKKEEWSPSSMQKMSQGDSFVYGTLDPYRVGNDFFFENGEVYYVSQEKVNLSEVYSCATLHLTFLGCL